MWLGFSLQLYTTVCFINDGKLTETRNSGDSGNIGACTPPDRGPIRYQEPDHGCIDSQRVPSRLCIWSATFWPSERDIWSYLGNSVPLFFGAQINL